MKTYVYVVNKVNLANINDHLRYKQIYGFFEFLVVDLQDN